MLQIFLKKLLTNREKDDILVKYFALQHSGGSIMFEKNMKVAYLLDFYADVLDEHTGSVMKAYYEDDLSLAEIAADVGISRQGIRHLIKKGEERIEFFESKLGLARRYDELSAVAESLSEIRERIKIYGELNDATDSLDNAIKIVLKGNQDVPESY